ncbi:MAG TPA: ZIP family metal transporter [Candidatus Paceibacterota bacterium]|nr:ZIP family metal transporter [Verrucomicrobiota bacterium]HRZ47073.1 ZIP family metal transporter [Candidatus Paceibacterota bacterium]HRZ92916.1 ZIP family metal transporter [Candidatus Paceibacterota bacterium]
MNNSTLAPVMLLAIYCALVFLAALAGGWLILALRLNHTRLQIAVSAVAGLMLGIALLHFIPHAVHQNQSVDQTMKWALGGFLAMFFLQRLFRYHHHHTAESPARPGGDRPAEQAPANPDVAPMIPGTDPGEVAHALSWAGTTIGLSLHSLVDGVALATAAFVGVHHANPGAGLGVALAVILHKPFGAMAISTLMTAEGCSRFLRQLVNLLFALVTPLSALLFYFGIDYLAGTNQAFQGNALAFCAGTFLCIACADLLPELQFHAHDRLGLSLALLAGLALALLLRQFGHAHSDLHPHEAVPEPRACIQSTPVSVNSPCVRHRSNRKPSAQPSAAMR